MVRLKRRNLYRLQINPLLRRRLLSLYAQYLQQRVNAIAFGREAFLWIEMLSNAWNWTCLEKIESLNQVVVLYKVAKSILEMHL